jgi:lipoprotein-anchoring transpeptidase ErfK/SrfK
VRVFGGLVAALSAAALAVTGAPHTLATRQVSLILRPASSALMIHTRPGGPVVARLGRTTDFGTRRVLGVVTARGGWVAVSTDAVPNGRLGWVQLDGHSELGVVDRAITVSLSARRLELFAWGRLERSFRIGIGAPSSPTPLGRFAVAEKFPGPWLGTVYGCCVLGLSAHQPHPPASWRPGDYLVAIHGGGGIGSAVSAGCIHLAEPALRYLMRRVPLGTPVFIRP